jgi:perosamine synthetase
MKVNQFEPFIDLDDWEATKDSFSDNWITEGPKSKMFMERLLSTLGTKHGSFAQNGTLALYMGLKAIGVQPGDEVIVPDATFIASANAVEMIGATPVFVDVDDHCQMNIDDMVANITSKTVAIMPVHLYGFAPDIEKIVEIAHQHNLLVIEDACQGFLVSWKGKALGTFGDVGCFSFFADKTITSGGEGGLVVTNNEKIHENMLFLRNQGRVDRGTFIHPRVGYNFRMTDIQSSIGLNQLKKVTMIIKRKLEVYNMYKLHL